MKNEWTNEVSVKFIVSYIWIIIAIIKIFLAVLGTLCIKDSYDVIDPFRHKKIKKMLKVSTKLISILKIQFSIKIFNYMEKCKI